MGLSNSLASAGAAIASLLGIMVAEKGRAECLWKDNACVLRLCCESRVELQSGALLWKRPLDVLRRRDRLRDDIAADCVATEIKGRLK